MQAFDSSDSLASMQREALPDVAVKPDAEAEPEDQQETSWTCFKQTDFYIARSIPTSFKYVDGSSTGDTTVSRWAINMDGIASLQRPASSPMATTSLQCRCHILCV